MSATKFASIILTTLMFLLIVGCVPADRVSSMGELRSRSGVCAQRNLNLLPHIGARVCFRTGAVRTMYDSVDPNLIIYIFASDIDLANPSDYYLYIKRGGDKLVEMGLPDIIPTPPHRSTHDTWEGIAVVNLSEKIYSWTPGIYDISIVRIHDTSVRANMSITIR